MKKFLKSPWVIALTPTFIGFILTVVYDMLKGKQVLSTIVYILKAIWIGIISFLNLNFKVWWLLVGVAAIVFILWIAVKIYLVINEEPTFMKYTKDTIHGWNWEWDWRKNYYGKYEIGNLHPVCDSCGTALTSKHDYQNNLYCVRCGNIYNGMNLPDENHIKLYISDSVNRGLIPEDKIKS